jgi:hypothetical protein
MHTLECAALGLALGLPLVALRVYAWDAGAAEELPALGEMHALMAEEAEPWLARFNLGHLAAHATLEVLPTLLLLLPAAQGGLAAGFEFYSSLLKQTLFGLGGGPDAAAALGDAGGAVVAAAAATPTGLGAVLAMLITATAAGTVQSLNLVQDEAEVDVVRDAVQNADRFYRLTAMEVGSSADDAARAATAFKAVAVSWMEAREDACAVAGAIAFVDVVWVSAIWYLTSDLAAAAAAALSISAVDYGHLYALTRDGGARGRRADRKRARGGSVPGESEGL